MALSLFKVSKDTTGLIKKLELSSEERVIFRPLNQKDYILLAEFLVKLLKRTREFYNLPSYDLKCAKNLCGSIGKYDKLRFIVITKSEDKIIALIEFSFGIPDGDKKRFLSYGIKLNEKKDLRFGPCIADDYQNKGVGSVLFPIVINIARKFNKKRIILWGGVLKKNKRAIRFYEKNGFKIVGENKEHENGESLDMILEL